MALSMLLGLAGALTLSAKAIVDNRHLTAKLQALTDRLRRLEEAASPVVSETGTASRPSAAPERDIPSYRPVEQPAAPRTPIEPPPASPPIAPALDWEKLLVENWLVWLGGITLALGGAFLVKLSIDHALLTPLVRVLVGALLGIGMAGTAEWISRRERGTPSHIPQALAAAGSAILFADVYAAYQLYGLISAGPAFVLLAGAAALAITLSLRHGPFVAALGLLGTFLVPALVRGTEPHSLSLFSYLAVVTAASLALLRHKAWWWLGWLSLAGSLAWVLLWLAALYAPGDAPILGGFLILLLGLFAALRRGLALPSRFMDPVHDPMVAWIVRAAFWAVSATMILLVATDGFTAASLVWVFAAMIGTLWLAFRDRSLDDLLAAAALPLLVLLSLWQMPWPAADAGFLAQAIPSADIARFEATALVGAILLGAAGFTAHRYVPRTGRWAALAVAAPLATLAIGYWRLDALRPDISWAGIAVLLAAVDLIAAERALRWQADDSRRDAALAAFAVGVLGGTVLAAAMILREAWLTVALALHLPILGWVEGRIRLPALRRLAVAVAGLVLARLVLNPEILHYPLTGGPIFNWLLYGYGVPTVAFLIATRQFGRQADDLLVKLLEAGSIACATALATFELRHWLGHSRIDFEMHSLVRDSAETLVWLAMAAALLRSGGQRQRQVLTWGGIALFCLATMQAVFWQALLANPLLSGSSVGTGFLLDSLLVAYGLPVVFYGVIALKRLGPPALWLTARGLALAFSLLWLTLEVRHGFRGSFLTGGEGSQAEWYAYSAAWLFFAAACLAVGLYRRSLWLRRTALAGIGLVVAKVFLSDVADLGGVWRALSFLGLGATLVVIGYAYRKLAPSRIGQTGPNR
jgi:uncharacterized membrane protein